MLCNNYWYRDCMWVRGPHLVFCQTCCGAARHPLAPPRDESRHMPQFLWVMPTLPPPPRGREQQSHRVLTGKGNWESIGARGVRKYAAENQTQEIREAGRNWSLFELRSQAPVICVITQFTYKAHLQRYSH